MITYQGISVKFGGYAYDLAKPGKLIQLRLGRCGAWPGRWRARPRLPRILLDMLYEFYIDTAPTAVLAIAVVGQQQQQQTAAEQQAAHLKSLVLWMDLPLGSVQLNLRFLLPE